MFSLRSRLCGNTRVVGRTMLTRAFFFFFFFSTDPRAEADDVVCFSCFLHVRNTFHVFVSDTVPWRVTQATCFFLFFHYYHYFSSFFLHDIVQFPNCPRFFLSLSLPFFSFTSLLVFFFFFYVSFLRHVRSFHVVLFCFCSLHFSHCRRLS